MPLYTVSDLTKYLKSSLEQNNLLNDIWVTGEVASFTRSAAGHMYFSLKDLESQIRCVMFRTGSGGEVLESGLSIVAHGRISLYEARGDLQFYAQLVRPQGMGELHLELERLKVNLAGEGLFDPTRKRRPPSFPTKIAVITSPTGAVWHDIKSVISRRYPLVELLLVPCNVQGANAVPSILEAFELLSDAPDLDAIILARGGGSFDELRAFNDEAVARAVYRSPKPVISAIGHETDVTLTDLVADLRAPTPSVAAELIVPDARELSHIVSQQSRRISESALGGVQERFYMVNRAVFQIGSRLPDITNRRQRVDDLLHIATINFKTTITLIREKVSSIHQRLASLDPKNVLHRGFAIIENETTRDPIRTSSDVKVNDRLRIHLHDGTLVAQVKEKLTTPPDKGNHN
jgi:exodeoxyribonuclease VII large subunit